MDLIAPAPAPRTRVAGIYFPSFGAHLISPNGTAHKITAFPHRLSIPGALSPPLILLFKRGTACELSGSHSLPHLAPPCMLLAHPQPTHSQINDYMARDDLQVPTTNTITLAQPPPNGAYARNHRRSRTTNFFSEERTQGAFAPMPSVPRRLTRLEKRPGTPIPPRMDADDSPSPPSENMLGLGLDGLTPSVTVEEATPPPSSSVPFPSLGPQSPLPLAVPPRPAPPLMASAPRKADIPRSASASSLAPPPSPGPATSPSNTPPHSPITLKNGRPLKPSLKSRSHSTPHLPSLPAHTRALSAPATPNYTPKNVHFAGEKEQLEHVVLFLREQRPIAVSNGTPEETETETDGEPRSKGYPFPRMGAPSPSSDSSSPPSGQRDRVLLDPARTSPVPNPSLLALRASHTRHPIMLESLLLPYATPLTLRGTVLVRNLAFHKSVAVRFTLDDWQTVSEVSAAYVNHLPSLPPPFVPHSPFAPQEEAGWDRFGFQVRLEDYERKIEDKTLFLVARYGANGQEWWDNNSGANYRVRFARAPPAATHTPSQAPSGTAVALPSTAAPPPPALAPAPSTPPITAPLPSPSSSDAPPKRSASFGQLNLKLLNYASPGAPSSPPRTRNPLAAEALAKDLAEDEEDGGQEDVPVSMGKLGAAAAVEKVEKRVGRVGVGAGAEFEAEQARAEAPKHEVQSIVLPPPPPSSAGSISSGDETTPTGPPAPASISTSASSAPSHYSPITPISPETLTTSPPNLPASSQPTPTPSPAPSVPPLPQQPIKKAKLFTVEPMTPPSSSEASPTHSIPSSPSSTPGGTKLDRSERNYEEFLQKYCFFRGPNDLPRTRSASSGMGGTGGGAAAGQLKV